MNKKVLLIEDDEDYAFIIAYCLKKASCEVLWAADGVKGLDMTLREKPDLIILDVLMPNMTGYEFVKKVRKEGGAASGVPIIVTSSRQSMEEYFDAWDIHAFVPKSPDVNILLEKVYSILGRAPGADASASSETASAQAPAPAPASGGRKVMVMGVDDYVVHKVKSALESQGVRVSLAISEEDAVQTAAKDRPDFVFCQYYEDTEKLDAQAIQLRLKKDARTQSIPFIPFCTEAISLDALKTTGAKEIVTFKTGNELVQNFIAFLNAHR